MASCERAFSFLAATPTRGSTRRSAAASFPAFFSTADSRRERPIHLFHCASSGRTVAPRLPLQAISATAFQRPASFPRFRRQRASFRSVPPVTPRPTQTAITTAWNFTLLTGQSRHSPLTRRSHASLRTSSGFHPARPSWTVRCSCVASSTSGTVVLTFICHPHVPFSPRVIHQSQQTPPNHTLAVTAHCSPTIPA